MQSFDICPFVVLALVYTKEGMGQIALIKFYFEPFHTALPTATYACSIHTLCKLLYIPLHLLYILLHLLYILLHTLLYILLYMLLY